MSDRRLRVAIAGLALVGVGITAYLVVVRYSDAGIFCSSGGCETVQHSKYAKVAGIPVAILGLVGYLLILASAALRSELARIGGAIVALVGFVFGMYLIWVQLEKIGATCDWCLASDGVLTLLLIATGLRVAEMWRPDQ